MASNGPAEHLGAWLRKARGERTQADVAEALGRTAAWVSMVESGRRTLRCVEDARTYAIALGKSPETGAKHWRNTIGRSMKSTSGTSVPLRRRSYEPILKVIKGPDGQTQIDHDVPDAFAALQSLDIDPDTLVAALQADPTLLTLVKLKCAEVTSTRRVRAK